MNLSWISADVLVYVFLSGSEFYLWTSPAGPVWGITCYFLSFEDEQKENSRQTINYEAPQKQQLRRKWKSSVEPLNSRFSE